MWISSSSLKRKIKTNISVALYISTQGMHSCRVRFVTSCHFVERNKRPETSAKKRLAFTATMTVVASGSVFRFPRRCRIHPVELTPRNS